MTSRQRPRKPTAGSRQRPKNPGLPEPASVVSERVLVSPKGRRYRILRTTERDPYDPPDRGGGKG